MHIDVYTLIYIATPPPPKTCWFYCLCTHLEQHTIKNNNKWLKNKCKLKKTNKAKKESEIRKKLKKGKKKHEKEKKIK